jgi:hypothetical protein
MVNDSGIITKPVAESLKIKTKNNRLWPSAPNSLSRRLNEVKTNLREIRIIIERPVDTTTNTRKIEIRKISPECPVSPEEQNQAQLQLENSGDITGDNNSISPDISRQQTLKIMLKILVPGIPVIPGILYILLLILFQSIV